MRPEFVQRKLFKVIKLMYFGIHTIIENGTNGAMLDFKIRQKTFYLFEFGKVNGIPICLDKEIEILCL